MQTFENAIYLFVACKNRVLFAFNSDNQRSLHIPQKNLIFGIYDDFWIV